MRSLFYSVLAYFLTPAGVVFLGVLDASVVFVLPFGIDFVVIIMTARKPELFWLYAVLATVGSVAGAALTYWAGRKVGKVGLSRLVKPARLARVQQRVGKSAAIGVAALAIIPPPFPFTAFVLTSGALGANAWSFLFTLSGARLLRFGIEAALAARYGRGILVWMKSSTFEVIVGALIALAVVGTVISAIAIWRSTRRTDVPMAGKARQMAASNRQSERIRSGSGESPRHHPSPQAAKDPR